MASDLLKAMFGVAPQAKAQDEAQVEAQEAQAESQFNLTQWLKNIMSACSLGEKTGKELLLVAGYRSRTGNFKKDLQRLVEEHLLELTIPDKPNSRLQKYRLTEKGRHVLIGIEGGGKFKRGRI